MCFFPTAMIAAVYEAQEMRKFRDKQYETFLADCRRLGLPPKTRHDFDLELSNAESLRRLSYQQPVIRNSIF